MTMDLYRCSICGHIYDPKKGDPSANIPPGTAFEDLPGDWHCPVCLAAKDKFYKYEIPTFKR
jgi:rubredoxin